MITQRPAEVSARQTTIQIDNGLDSEHIHLRSEHLPKKNDTATGTALAELHSPRLQRMHALKDGLVLSVTGSEMGSGATLRLWNFNKG